MSSQGLTPWRGEEAGSLSLGVEHDPKLGLGIGKIEPFSLRGTAVPPTGATENGQAWSQDTPDGGPDLERGVFSFAHSPCPESGCSSSCLPIPYVPEDDLVLFLLPSPLQCWCHRPALPCPGSRDQSQGLVHGRPWFGAW